ncbi:hypothetical protein TWF281_004089 [Arthrobotrys megalospora]
MLWKVPFWVLETKGPEWVYQWQNQGVYPENPWSPEICARKPDALYDSPLFKKLLETSDFNGAMYYAARQTKYEMGINDFSGFEDYRQVFERIEERAPFLNAFMKSVEEMQKREGVARKYSEKYGKDYFDPLEDLEDPEDIRKEHEYAA